jgi:Flp pilus assembly protein CpaB
MTAVRTPSGELTSTTIVRAIARQATRHRRLLAALLLAAAVASALGVVAPSPASTSIVVVASRPLDAGTSLGSGDVRVEHRPVGTNPGALTSTASAIGRVLAGAVGAGEALTAARLVGPGLAAGLAKHGHVAAPVRLSDPAVASLLKTGDVIDVVLAGATSGSPVGGESGGSATVVAAGARVIAVVAPANDAVLGTSADGSGGLVVLDVRRDQALDLARAAALGPLSVLLDA